MNQVIDEPHAREFAQLPFREGGLGLRCAQRQAVGSYWASWTDTLPQIAARHPDIANWLCDELEFETESTSASIRAANEAKTKLGEQGMLMIPSWTEARLGVQPPIPHNPEPGEFTHGWQYHAVAALNTSFVSIVLVPQLSQTDAAIRLLSSGRCAGRHFTAIPISKETSISSERFRVLLSVRLRLDLPLTSFRCKCGQ